MRQGLTKEQRAQIEMDAIRGARIQQKREELNEAHVELKRLWSNPLVSKIERLNEFIDVVMELQALRGVNITRLLERERRIIRREQEQIKINKYPHRGINGEDFTRRTARLTKSEQLWDKAAALKAQLVERPETAAALEYLTALMEDTKRLEEE